MRVSDVLTLMKKNAGENPYKIYLPSIKQEIVFRPMTAGMQKTISRVAVDDESPVYADYKLTQLACVKALAVSPLDESTLTDVDFLVALAGIRLYNKEPLGLVYPCSCGSKTAFSLDCNYILEAGKKRENKNETFTQGDFWFELGDPKMIDIINYEMMIEIIEKDMKEVDSKKLRITNYPVQFLKRVRVKGDEVEDFPRLKYTEKIEFLDALPPGIIYGDGDTLTRFVLEKYSPNRLKDLFQIVKCSKCGKEEEGVVSTSNFFTI